MATKPKNQVGTMECRCCHRHIPVREADTGTLNVSCQWCDFSAYAKHGTEAARIIRAQMTAREGDALPLVKTAPEPQPTPTPAAPPVKTPAPTPAPAPRRILF